MSTYSEQITHLNDEQDIFINLFLIEFKANLFTIEYTYFGYLSKYQTMIYCEFCAFNYDVFIEFLVFV